MVESRVLVTGARGFLGRPVCAALAARGHQVRAMVRVPGEVENAAGVVADLGDDASLARATQGMEAVVHLAARVHVMRETASDPLQEFRRVNVEGTRALLDAARGAGVRRFVYISSVKALGERSDEPLSSRSSPAPLDPYGVSKLEAERLVASYGSAAMRTAVLRLPLVYGPRVKGNMLRLFQLIDRGLPLPLGGIDNRRSIVYAGNVAAAIVHLLSRDVLPAGPYFVSDDEDLSTPALARRIGESLQRPARLVTVPRPLLRAVRSAGAAAASAGLPSIVGVLDRLTDSLRVDGREIQRETGFSLPFDTVAGLRETAAWYRGEAVAR